MSRKSILCWAVLASLLGTLGMAGCGKKGDPVPARLKLAAAVDDLSAASTEAGILLRWSLPRSLPESGGFRILRSDTEGGEACPGCPQEYRTLVQLSIADRRLERDGEKGIRYLDADVLAGRFYSYRVAICEPRGDCREASAPVRRMHQRRSTKHP